MKTLLLIALVGLLSVTYSGHAAVIQNIASPRANLIVGNTTVGDTLLLRQYLYRQAQINTIQTEELIYRGNSTTRISSVRATEVGATQYGSAWVAAGGVGYSNVTVRVQSYRGYGYYYNVEIWGRLR